MFARHLHAILQRFETERDKLSPGERAVLDKMAAAPVFVFSKDVLKFMEAHKAELDAAVAVAMEAGRTELPFDPMVIELTCAGGFEIWLIEGIGEGRFFLSAFWDVGWIRVICGKAVFMTNAQGQIFPGEVLSRVPAAFLTKLPPDLHQPVLEQIAVILRMAQMLNIRGIVVRPARPPSVGLNKLRRSRAKPVEGPAYKIVHIGYTTDREGRRHAYEEGKGHHVRVHLRRGHIRNQPYGPGRAQVREIWIQQTLINYRPGGPPPVLEHRVVP